VKIIVSTGYSDSGFQSAHQILLTAGLQEAGASQREGLTVHQIQEKIFKAYQKESGSQGTSLQLSPGRIWQELAANLLISNSDHSEWGWADERTIKLLDFWKEIEPEICFVLIYSSPEFAVAQALRNQSTQETIQNIIAGWEACNSELLRFYNRHTDQCMLVNVLAITHAPEQFIEHAADFFELDLKNANIENQGRSYELSAMPALLASRLIADYQDTIALYCELESSANITGSSFDIESAEKLLAWQEYTSLLSDLDQTIAERDEHVNLVKERQCNLEQLTAKLGDLLNSLNSKQSEIDAQQVLVSELTQENELLLLQLHQVQEELEHYFLQYQGLNGNVQRELGHISFLTQFWHEQQPSEIHIDMKGKITGENWYDAEVDGRWAGPANTSTLKIPELRNGRYSIILDIADASDPEIMTGLELKVNGVPVQLIVHEYYGGPELFEAEFTTSDIPKASIWEIQFKFPKLISPTQHDAEDHRLLAIRLQSLSLNLL